MARVSSILVWGTIGLAFLAVLDVALTLCHIQWAGGSEFNPLMDWVLLHLGMLPFLSCKMLLTGAGIFVLIYFYNKMFWARVGFWSVLVAHVVLIFYHVVLAIRHW